MNDNQKVLNQLIQYRDKGIHSFELIKLCGTYRVAARIKDLKNQGYSITSNREKLGNSWGVRYFLNNPPIKKSYIFDPIKQVYFYG